MVDAGAPASRHRRPAFSIEGLRKHSVGELPEFEDDLS